MTQKSSGVEITVSISFPKGLWTEAIQWTGHVNEPVDALVHRSLRHYLDEKRRKAFLASNPIYE
jgi:hypothetical protein